MNQNVTVPTIIVVFVMVVAILTVIWYLMFDKAHASGVPEREMGSAVGVLRVAPASMLGDATAPRDRRPTVHG